MPNCLLCHSELQGFNLLPSVDSQTDMSLKLLSSVWMQSGKSSEAMAFHSSMLTQVSTFMRGVYLRCAISRICSSRIWGLLRMYLVVWCYWLFWLENHTNSTSLGKYSKQLCNPVRDTCSSRGTHTRQDSYTSLLGSHHVITQFVFHAVWSRDG
jgi:hypothetical protein